MYKENQLQKLWDMADPDQPYAYYDAVEVMGANWNDNLRRVRNDMERLNTELWKLECLEYEQMTDEDVLAAEYGVKIHEERY